MHIIPIIYFYIIITKQINFLSQYPEEWIILLLTANHANKSYSAPFQSNYILKFIYILSSSFVNTIWCIGFTVLTAAVVKNSVFWDITCRQMLASCWSLAWPKGRSNVFLLNLVDFHWTTRRYIAAVRNLVVFFYFVRPTHIPGSSHLPPLLPYHLFPRCYSSRTLHA